MKMFRRLSCVLAVPLLLVACAASGVHTERAAGVSNNMVAGLLEISERPVVAQHHGSVDVLYFNAKNELLLHRADGDEQVLGDDGAGTYARRAFAVLHTDGDATYVLWRPKLSKEVPGIGVPGDKLVYFRASLDRGKTFGPAHRLNEGGGAFTPVIASNGLGDVYVVYTDERMGSEINLFMNQSHDRGASWEKEELRINGPESIGMSLNPSVVTDGRHVYVAWMTRGTDNQFKLFVRQSEDQGRSWLAPVAAHSSPMQPSFHKLVKINNALLLCWSNQDAVRCNRSLDNNQSWSGSVALEDSVGAEGILLEADAKGRAHLLVAKKPEGAKMRLNLYYSSTEDGVAFPTLQRISGGTPHAASTISPLLAFGDDDSVMVTWVDMRYARPVVAGNYSANGGKTWLADNVVLAATKGKHHMFPSMAYVGRGKYRIIWQESAVRTTPTTQIGSVEYGPSAKGVDMPKPDMERLKQRVNAFWSLRQEDNKWDQIYDYMDPFFREASSRKGYVRSQGLVKYYEHQISGEPKLNGIYAFVPLKYVSEVPEAMVFGKQLSVPKQEVEIEHEWMWIDGDWYQVFRDIKNGSFLPE